MELKLSEAIRLAQFEPQGFFAVCDDDGYLCAWGGALNAVGLLEAFTAAYDNAGRREVIRRSGWLELVEAPSVCPQCGDHLPWIAVPHLNDRHQWSRSRIADWVETIESKQVQSVTEALSHP